MFHGLAVGWADLVLPATSSLERDGTLLNLEGRLQRLRRAVIAPVPDELAWIAKLAERFDVTVSPHAVVVFDELSALDLRRRRRLGAERHRQAARADAVRGAGAGTRGSPRRSSRARPASTSSASSA